MACFICYDDGSGGTAQHLGLDDWQAIAHREATALQSLVGRCHHWEEHDDPEGQRLPRARRHDDKAIASVLMS